jgi:hypothetical protein
MNIQLTDQDYDLAEGAAWFGVKNFAIRIHQTDEGVVVDIYKSGKEMDGSLASTYAFDSECEEEDEPEREEVETPFRCGSCGLDMEEWALLDIKRLWSRVDPGDTMPAGECPSCRGLVYRKGDLK